MNLKLLSLIAAIVAFVIVALGVKTDFDLIAVGLVFFAASFLPI